MPTTARSDFKLKMIESAIEHALGTSSIEPETANFSSHIDKACLRFYTAQPIRKLFGLSVVYGTNFINLESARTQLFSSFPDEYYFIGVTRSDFLLTGEEFERGDLDFFLAGVEARPVPAESSLTPFDPMAGIFLETKEDIKIGEEHFEYDEIAQKIRVTVPAAGSINVELAFGYCGDGVNKKAYDGVPMDQIQLLGNLVVEEVLEDIITGRSSVNLNGADFDLDTSALEKKYDLLSERNEEELTLIAVPVALLG